jgi:ankyrin repeat protein
MAAQDIYIQFLMSILADLKAFDWDADIVSRTQSSFFARCTRIDELVGCFESGKLGSREDALLCIVPVLRHRNLLPELAADSKGLRERVERLTSGLSANDWDSAFSMVRWLCERSEGQEFERSVYELGLLAQRAMVHKDVNVREKGFRVARSLLEKDIRARFFQTRRPSHWMNSPTQQHWWSKYARQLGWVTWHIVDTKGDRQAMKGFLTASGVSGNFEYQANYSVTQQIVDTHAEQHPGSTQIVAGFPEESVQTGLGDSPVPERLTIAQLTFLGWAIPDFNFGSYAQMFDNNGEACMKTCLEWTIQSAQNALCYWILAYWAAFSESECPGLTSTVFTYGAQCNSDFVIQTLRRRADINAPGGEGRTALLQLMDAGYKNAVERLLVNGGTNPPLNLAAGQGNEELLLLLLKYGADIETCDSGITPLHTACVENRFNTAILLLERGADIESTVRGGVTPLISATVKGNLKMVEFILSKGANVDATDNDGSTALLLAAHGGFDDIIRLLLDHSADARKQDYFGRTALDIAKQSGARAEIIALLEAAL